MTCSASTTIQPDAPHDCAATDTSQSPSSPDASIGQPASCATDMVLSPRTTVNPWSTLTVPELIDAMHAEQTMTSAQIRALYEQRWRSPTIDEQITEAVKSEMRKWGVDQRRLLAWCIDRAVPALWIGDIKQEVAQDIARDDYMQRRDNRTRWDF